MSVPDPNDREGTIAYLEGLLTGESPEPGEAPRRALWRPSVESPDRWAAAGALLSPRTRIGTLLGVSRADLRHAQALLEGRAALRPAGAALKRAVDVVFAATFIVLVAPVLLALAALVRMDSRGPVLFMQTRIGQYGQPFSMYKFRTMHMPSEEWLATLSDGGPAAGLLFKMRGDPRITPVGRFLRRYSLDELPQLFNVLRGDMSLVGPRPPLTVEFERHNGMDARRLLVRPGITGLWQASASRFTWDESSRLDLAYVESWTPGLDARILWRTLTFLLRGAGAY